MTPPVYVIGSGAIGTFLAERLSRFAKTHLIIRDASKSAPLGGVELRGSVTEPNKKLDLITWSRISQFEKGALILVASKIFDLPQILEDLGPRIDSSHTVVLCQNGVGVQELAQKHLPEATFARAVCWFGIRLEHDTQSSRSILHVAGIDSIEFSFPKGSGHDALFETWMEKCGIPPRRLESSAQVEWRKALWNIAANGLCALAEAPNGEAAQNPLLRPIAEGLYEEAAAVAKARGVPLAADVKERCFAGMIRTGTNLNSTLMDLRAGRKTEVEWLNGAVVKWADELGIPCPHNRTITNLIRYLEASGRA